MTVCYRIIVADQTINLKKKKKKMSNTRLEIYDKDLLMLLELI